MTLWLTTSIHDSQVCRLKNGLALKANAKKTNMNLGMMALYCIAVAMGVVKNKDNSLSPEQMERVKKFYEKHRKEQKNGVED